jgi:hypothetical protein
MSSWKESAEGRRESGLPSQPDFESELAPEPPRGLDPSLINPSLVDPNLLEKVLEKTLDVGESPEALDGTLRAALLNYAVQNRRGELSESRLADLVRIVLSHEMALLAAQPSGQARLSLVEEVAEQVAHSIWDDPTARGRISTFWRLWQGGTT